MYEATNAENISQKLESFVQDTPEKFEALLAQLTRLGKRIMGKFYDLDEHGGTQMFLNIHEKIVRDERKWDHENVTLEAMFHKSAESILSSELKKKLYTKNKVLSYDKLAKRIQADQTENLNNYEDGVLPSDEKGREKLGSYGIQPASSGLIEQMTIRELRAVNGETDKVVLDVMQVIKEKGVKQRKEIAEILNISEKLVRNAFDKIHRAGNKVFEKLTEADKEYIKTFKTNYRFNETRKRIKEREKTN